MRLHPDSVCDAIRAFEVEVSREGTDRLTLTYEIEGEIEDLRLSPVRAGSRADGLWRHTCLEAFVKPAGADAYLELNLAPSGDFAAYRFAGYRAGMTEAADVAPFVVETDSRPSRRASLGRGKRDGWYRRRVTWIVSGRSPSVLALSAVVEETSGRKSYWALWHPPGAPNFHHPDCFTLELPAPEAP